MAARLCVDRERVDTLLGLLHSEGLLAPPDPDRLALWQAEHLEPTSPSGAPDSPEPCQARRRPAYVVVGGWGPVPRAIASTLRAAGVGRVETGPWALDHAELDLRGESGRPPAPELVVLAAQDVLDRGAPHSPGVATAWRSCPSSLTHGPSSSARWSGPTPPARACAVPRCIAPTATIGGPRSWPKPALTARRTDRSGRTPR